MVHLLPGPSVSAPAYRRSVVLADTTTTLAVAAGCISEHGLMQPGFMGHSYYGSTFRHLSLICSIFDFGGLASGFPSLQMPPLGATMNPCSFNRSK